MKLVEDILTDRRQEVLAHRKAYEEALSRDPEYARLDKEIKELGFRLLGCAVGNTETGDIADRMRLLTRERDELAKARGLSPYLCSACRDEGQVNGEICSCRRRQIYAEHYGAADPRSFERGLKGYPTSRIDDATEAPEFGRTARQLTKLALKGAARMINAYPNGGRGLLIFGRTGTGKTSIATAIAKSAFLKGIDTLYLSAVRMNELYYAERMGAPVELRYLETSGLLIIDDLGAEPMTTNVTTAGLYRILERRADRLLPTVFLTNLDSAGMRRRYGERISSRLCNEQRYIPIPLGGQDLRTGAVN